MRGRLLITGIAGFFGAHLFEHVLKNTELEVVGIASWRHKGTPERIEEVVKGNPSWKDRVTIITHDLSAPLPFRTVERIGDIDYIVNAASDSHVDRSIEDPVPFVSNNVNLQLTMLELARVLKPRVFLQFSTDEVYGVAPDGVNHPEWAAIVPSNPYSASKAAQEALAISYWRTYGVPLVITNTMNMFGQFQEPEKYVAQLIRKINAGEKVTVHGSEGRIGSRFYLHARNAADAVLYILAALPPVIFQEDKDILPDRYNIVGDKEVDNLELAYLVAGMVGKTLYYELDDVHSHRPGHDRRYALDGKKLRDKGWKAPLDFERSLKDTVDWTLANPAWL